MKARDLMMPVQACLTHGDRLREFVEKIAMVNGSEHPCGARSLLVLDKEENLVGVLSMRDILKAIYPSCLYTTDLSQFTRDGMLESLHSMSRGKRYPAS